MNTLKKSLLVFSTLAWVAVSAATGEEVKSTLTDANEINQQPTATRMRSGAFDGTSSVLSIGLGLGGSYYGFNSGANYSSGRTPLFAASYEIPLQNKVGPGYICLGPYLAFQNAHERYDYNYFYNGLNDKYYRETNWNYFVIALKGAYHWDELNFEKFDIYGGGIVGVRFNTVSYKNNNPDPNYTYTTSSSGRVYPALGVYAGARWFFAPRVALYGEAGFGVSWLTAGLSFKI